MYSELECGVCYRTFNAGLRCPRELSCRHSFCETCLLALSRPQRGGRPGAPTLISCPFCREATSISAEGSVRAELRVDESAMERLITAGILEQPEEEEEEEEEEAAPNKEQEETPESSAEESDASAESRRGGLRRSWKKVWRAIRGSTTGIQGQEENCMTADDLRNMALLSSYMF